jgi:hypothetical protein
MQYCSRDHQAADRTNHKPACNTVKKCRKQYDHEERALSAHPGDFMMQADPFTNSVGHFWGILETRKYMRARYALVEAILKINTFVAVKSALDHLMDMLRLCRGDNLGVRDLVPSLLLRLDEDQKCYDFVKWWETSGQDSHYDWGDMSLPYLNIINANVFEPVDYLCGQFPHLSFTVSITLLKIKLLLDLEGLRNSDVLAPKAPQEIIDKIKQYVPRSTIISGDTKIMNRKVADQAKSIEELNLQIEQLYETVRKTNKYFWLALLKPDGHLVARPELYSRGSVAEMQLVLQYSYMSWRETPGALDLIKAKTAR